MNTAELSDMLRRAVKERKKEAFKEVVAARTGLQVISPRLDDLSKRSIDALETFMPEFEGTFLDVGCYGGWVYPLVRDRVEYTGIDIWPTGIEVATALFGPRFHLINFEEYNTQHDIVWVSHLQPEYTITKDAVEKLKTLYRKLLIIVDAGVEAIPDISARGHNWIAFRK